MWHDRTPIRFHSGRGASSCASASRFFGWPSFPLRTGAKHRARTKVKNHSDTIIIGEEKMMKKTYLLISGATLCCVPLAYAAQAQTSSGIEQAVPVPQTEEPSGAGDIVVTAQRRSERLQDIPMAITALNAESRSEEHTSELQSLMRISYAVFCLKKKKHTNIHNTHNRNKPQ